MRVDLFPESARAYEFLGDMWAAKKDATKARADYEQSLTRNADNAALREKMDKLGR